MEQNIFLQEYLYQLKNILNILLTLLRLIRGNLIEYQKEIFKVQLFADYHI